MLRRGSLLALAVAAAGCPHVIHPARVTPGWSAEALVAATRVGNQDPHPAAGVDPTGSERELDLQVDVRRGWALGGGRGLQVDVMAPWAIAGYAQLRANPDLGAGVVLGPNPGLYAMVGALRAGLLAEHLELAEPVTGCDEACMTGDYTRRRTSVGLFVGQTWR